MTAVTAALPPGYRDIPDRLNIAGELIDRIPERGFGDRTAFVWDAGELSFDAFAARVNRLAHGLAANGIAPGMPVLVRMHNCHEFAETFFRNAVDQFARDVESLGDFTIPGRQFGSHGSHLPLGPPKGELP